MTAVATRAERWNATNSNGRTAANSSAGWLSDGPEAGSSGGARFEALHSFKECHLSRAFQGRFWPGRVRSQRWGCGMDERVQQYCDQSAAEVGRHAAEIYSQWLWRFLPDCDSEIERLLCAAFLRLEDLNRSGAFVRFRVTGGLYGMNRPRTFADVRSWAWELREDSEARRVGCYLTYCYPQVNFDPYCVDFLVGSLCIRKTEQGISRLENWIAVECDGHEFHDKTKKQAQRDKARDRFLVSAGVKVMRFTGSEIWRDPTRCALEVANAADPDKTFLWIGEALS
jgi:hypothetical protein